MKHIITLIRYDLRSQLRERGTLFLLLAALLLALLGLFEGARFESVQRRAVADAASQESTARVKANALANSYFDNPDKPEFAQLQWYRTPIDVRGYAFREHVGFAAKPALPGAALAIGQADLLPAYVRVRAESMESVRTASEIEHPGRLAAGRFDLLFFVVYLWPLFLLSLSVSVLTQDRESKRIRALLLQGVQLGRLLLAQVMARVLLASIALVAACGMAALLSGVVPISAGGFAALAAWGGIVLLYSAFWGAVAAAVCAVCHSRMTASFAAFGCWVLLAVLLPGAQTVGVRLLAPVPARELYVQAMRDANDEVNANKLASLARFYDSHPEWKPNRTALEKVSSSVSRIQRAQELEAAMRGVERQHAAARQKQDSWFDSLQIFSPVTLAYQSLATLAGKDKARQQRFLREVALHQGQLRDFFQRAIQEAALGDERQPCVKSCLGGYGFRDFDSVPRFRASMALAEPGTPGTRLAALPAWTLALLVLAVLLAGARRGKGH
ncbi:DUF3526 domain-containing protein [Massilia sp. YIM B04103]|uniref:DUF3526 domain-containing protein n=1 Tax=Massilia sp. YIM B04103 TaxID=2963106 RepID=UPI00210E8CA8|nr:DUF3526 domain-containing protein [Massilia sp. YIM B04103]